MQDPHDLRNEMEEKTFKNVVGILVMGEVEQIIQQIQESAFAAGAESARTWCANVLQESIEGKLGAVLERAATIHDYIRVLRTIKIPTDVLIENSYDQ